MKVRMDMIYEKARKERDRLELKITETKKQLEKLPEGKLLIARNGKHYKWYRSDGHTKEYLSKKERTLAEQLAVKKYLSYQIVEMEQEKKAIEFYLRHHNKLNYTEEMLNELTEYRELLASYFKPVSEELEEWRNMPYNSNLKYPEQLLHKASGGKKVRSKSELMIDNALYKNKIPFRYECELYLGTSVIYPDFTIRHPKTGEVYYWEHFGKMDDINYCKSVCAKLQLYTSQGIIPSIHLITTYETQKNPLSIGAVDKIIEEYFGD